MASRNHDAADPFWSVVADRHPDIDIVVLPPEPPAVPRAADAADLDRRRQALDSLAARIAEALPPDVDGPVVDVVAGPQPDTVRLRAKATGTTADGAAFLDGLAATLPDAVRRGGAVEQLDAEVDGLRVRATWAPTTGVLALRVESVALQVVR